MALGSFTELILAMETATWLGAIEVLKLIDPPNPFLLGTASWNEHISSRKISKISSVLSQNGVLFPHLTELSVPHPLHLGTR